MWLSFLLYPHNARQREGAKWLGPRLANLRRIRHRLFSRGLFFDRVHQLQAAQWPDCRKYVEPASGWGRARPSSCMHGSSAAAGQDTPAACFPDLPLAISVRNEPHPAGAAGNPGCPSLQYLGASLHAFQLDEYQRNGRRSNTRDARGLAYRCRACLFKLMTRFHREAGDCVIVEVVWDSQVLLSTLPLNILKLFLNVSRIFNLNFDLLGNFLVFNTWAEKQATFSCWRLH